MPRKSAMRDYVSAVRSRLPHLSSLPREKIELALLYYESNVDETVEAFKRGESQFLFLITSCSQSRCRSDGAIEALGGWTEMTSDRGSVSRRPFLSLSRRSTLASLPSELGQTNEQQIGQSQ